MKLSAQKNKSSFHYDIKEDFSREKRIQFYKWLFLYIVISLTMLTIFFISIIARIKSNFHINNGGEFVQLVKKCVLCVIALHFAIV